MSKFQFSAVDLQKYLRRLSDELSAKGIKGKLTLFGGAVMVLALNARPATQDLDGVFHPKTEIYAAAKRIAAQEGLPEGWLNDGVKGFLSQAGTASSFLDLPGLAVYLADPEYMLAMKCVAGRDEDVEDILCLTKHLGIRSAAEAIDVVTRYYPEGRLLPKTRFLLEELLRGS